MKMKTESEKHCFCCACKAHKQIAVDTLRSWEGKSGSSLSRQVVIYKEAHVGIGLIDDIKIIREMGL